MRRGRRRREEEDIDLGGAEEGKRFYDEIQKRQSRESFKRNSVEIAIAKRIAGGMPV